MAWGNYYCTHTLEEEEMKNARFFCCSKAQAKEQPPPLPIVPYHTNPNTPPAEDAAKARCCKKHSHMQQRLGAAETHPIERKTPHTFYISKKNRKRRKKEKEKKGWISSFRSFFSLSFSAHKCVFFFLFSLLIYHHYYPCKVLFFLFSFRT